MDRVPTLIFRQHLFCILLSTGSSLVDKDYGDQEYIIFPCASPKGRAEGTKCDLPS